MNMLILCYTAFFINIEIESMSADQVIFGYHAVRAILSTQPQLVKQLIASQHRKDARLAHIVQLANKHHITIEKRSSKDFANLLAKGQTHQGIVAVCCAQPAYAEADIELLLEGNDKTLILILDQVQDPHNLGACLRSANAFGVDCVIAPKNNSVGINATVAKVACGAASMTPFVQVTNLARTMKKLQQLGVWFVGMDAQSSEQLCDIDLIQSTGLVMGSEGSGMRRLTKETCDFLAKIVMPGEVSSVNVSVATGIALYEINRQRLLV